MNSSKFQDGLTRGIEERWSSTSIVDLLSATTIFESDEDRDDREEGFKAGLIIAALRDEIDDE